MLINADNNDRERRHVSVSTSYSAQLAFSLIPYSFFFFVEGIERGKISRGDCIVHTQPKSTNMIKENITQTVTFIKSTLQ